MNLTSKRGVEPLALTLTLVLDEADLLLAFGNGDHEHLFFSAFSNAWAHLPTSEKLSVASQITLLAETVPPPVTAERLDELTGRLDVSAGSLSEEVNPNR